MEKIEKPRQCTINNPSKRHAGFRLHIQEKKYVTIVP